jgi:uncharacterized protein
MSRTPRPDSDTARARVAGDDRPAAGDAPPVRVDIAARAREQARMTGRCVLAQLPRLAEHAEPAADPSSTGGVSWQADFSLRAAPGRAAQPWLHLGAQAKLTLVCQRCLAPVDAEVAVARDFRFVADERTAEMEDEASEEDVLASSQRFDLRGLLEDELLMALPIVPMHEACPQPLVAPDRAGGAAAGPGEGAASDAVSVEKPHPFAVLGRLKMLPSSPDGRREDDRGDR